MRQECLVSKTHTVDVCHFFSRCSLRRWQLGWLKPWTPGCTRKSFLGCHLKWFRCCLPGRTDCSYLSDCTAASTSLIFLPFWTLFSLLSSRLWSQQRNEFMSGCQDKHCGSNDIIPLSFWQQTKYLLPAPQRKGVASCFSSEDEQVLFMERSLNDLDLHLHFRWYSVSDNRPLARFWSKHAWNGLGDLEYWDQRY